MYVTKNPGFADSPRVTYNVYQNDGNYVGMIHAGANDNVQASGEIVVVFSPASRCSTRYKVNESNNHIEMV